VRRPLTRTLELEQERLALVTRHFGDVSLSAITANAIADFQRARHAAGIANRTELAEMGVADHVLESISGHLSRRMLEHYSHIRIDAKRQALDALGAARRSSTDRSDGNRNAANETEIPVIVEVGDDLTSQLRHSLVLRGSPPAGKLLIPFDRRDVRVVEGARLENEQGDAH